MFEKCFDNDPIFEAGRFFVGFLLRFQSKNRGLVLGEFKSKTWIRKYFLASCFFVLYCHVIMECISFFSRGKHCLQCEEQKNQPNAPLMRL